MEEIKEVQTIREKMENNNFLHFIGEVMESDKTERVIVDYKWREKIKGTLMDDYELGVDEFIKNFKYTGGDGRRYGTHDDREKDKRANRHLNYWNITRNNEIHPLHKKYCICKTFIIENCYAVDKRDKEKLVCLGNCCIERFLGDNAKRTCERCEKPHRNRKDNFCKECRKQNKEDEKKRMEDEKLKRIEEQQKKGMEEYKKRLEESNKRMEEEQKKRMEGIIEYRERRKQKEIEYREKQKQKEMEEEERRKENERVWTNEEIQEILIKIYENSKRGCCAEKYEDEEKINDDFKICGKDGCEKLIKKCYKYCYLCYNK
jgi:hypothetical protein